jgi:ubiquinone/menaquinone biosynthesis C-methylase UbiE
MTMAKMDNIQLLDTDLLEKKRILKEVLYWKNLFRAQIGWHYILDLIWQIESIESLELTRGAKILDAGAGIGLMQYILAARGFEIYSIDFAARKITWPKSWIFQMQYLKNRQHTDDYLDHLFRDRRSSKINDVLYELKKMILNYHFKLIKEILSRNQHGKIYYYQEDFSKMTMIGDGFFDAVVSTSAIEHNKDFEKLGSSVKEFLRVLKTDMPLLITTSATNKKTWFHEPSFGWCFSQEDLASIFEMNEHRSNFYAYESVYNNIQGNEFLKKKLAKHYYTSASGGLPYGVWKPAYLPAGITKWKR